MLQRSIGRRNGAADVVRFHPALPEWKKDAIDSVNFEHYCKIFLQFNATFWDDTEIFMWADDTGHGWFPAWQNIERLAPGSNTLMVTVVGDKCVQAAHDPDQQTIDDAMYVLRSFFPAAPDPLNAYIGKWATDEWTYGSSPTTRSTRSRGWSASCSTRSGASSSPASTCPTFTATCTARTTRASTPRPWSGVQGNRDLRLRGDAAHHHAGGHV